MVELLKDDSDAPQIEEATNKEKERSFFSDEESLDSDGYDKNDPYAA